MHEMGVVINIVQIAEQFARENDADKVGRLVLQIGEISSVIPHYVEACWPGAIENTMLSEAELVIEIVPGHGACQGCGKVYNLLEHDLKCPECDSDEWEVISGREVMIKEIGVY